MTFRIEMSRRAQRDIQEATIWYRHRSGSAEVSDEWLERITDAMESLVDDPERCQLAHESDTLGIDVRELLFGSGRRITHRILFLIEEHVIKIIRIRHTTQRDLTSDDF